MEVDAANGFQRKNRLGVESIDFFSRARNPVCNRKAVKHVIPYIVLIKMYTLDISNNKY